MKTRNKLIATLIDENHIDAAKQLFASTYLNSGWDGDYLILAHNIKDEKLIWFKTRGIYVYKTKALDNQNCPGGYPPIILSKLYLFKEYFKKWKKIIFLDADIIVRNNLDKLLESKIFAAPQNNNMGLKDEVVLDKFKKKYKKKYDLKSPVFTSGIFSFNSNIIDKDTFKKLLKLHQDNREEFKYNEESVLNIFFYKNWLPLSDLYNYNPDHLKNMYYLNIFKRIEPILYHFFCVTKPWNPKSSFYNEWTSNLSESENINFQKMPHVKEKYNIYKLEKKLFILKNSINKIRPLLLIPSLIDRQIGKIGLLIKKYYPKLYQKIKRRKN